MPRKPERKSSMSLAPRPRLAGLALLALGLAAVSTPAVLAQVAESEPNDSCAAAQDLTSVTLPAAASGSLDTPPADPDIDFFRFTAAPGTWVEVRVDGAGATPLLDPDIGVFDSSCAFFSGDVGPSE